MAGIAITNSTIKLPFSSLFKGTHFSGFRSSIAHLYLLAFHRNTKGPDISIHGCVLPVKRAKGNRLNACGADVLRQRPRHS